MDNAKTVKVPLKILDERAVIPTYGTTFSAGADLYACLERPVAIKPGETFLVHTGFAVEIPEGMAGFIYGRSGLSTKEGLAPANKVGVIDSDYRGEIMVSIYNHSDEERVISPGDRVAQMVIAPFYKAEWEITGELKNTDRGDGGFGSTGSGLKA